MRIKKKKLNNIILLLLLFLNVTLFSYLAANIFLPNARVLQSNSDLSLSTELEAQKIADFCRTTKSLEECYSVKFKDLTNKTNLIFAKKTLASLQDIDPRNSRGCHLIAHSMTIAETRKDPAKWMELLKQVDSNSCTGGYVHGILEAHMASQPDFVLTAEEVPKICSLLPDANAGGDLNCSHNLGHILLAQENNNIEKGVNICDKVAGERVKYECLSGVFMERMTRLNLEVHGIAKRIPWNEKNTKEMEGICRKFTGVAGVTCWREIAHMFATFYRNDYKKVFEACNLAPEFDAARDCYMHASSIMTVSSRFNEEDLNKICFVYAETDPLYNICMGHMIGGMLLSSEKFSDTTLKLCAGTYVSYKKECYKKVGTSLAGVVPSREKREKICSRAPEDYRSICLYQQAQGSKLN